MLSLQNMYNLKDDNGNTYLHILIIKDDKDSVFTLCQNSPDIDYVNAENKQGMTPLITAVKQSIFSKNGFIVTKCLLDFGADRKVNDFDGNTAMHYACSRGHLNILQILTQGTFMLELEDTNEDGFNCLHLATMGGHVEIVKFLLELKVNVNAIDDHCRMSPLHHAIYNKNINSIKLLADHGADVDINCTHSRYSTTLKQTSLDLAKSTKDEIIIYFINEMIENLNNKSTIINDLIGQWNKIM